MQDTQVENTQRWRAWRAACEGGRDRAEAYDQYLHPATRITLDGLSPEHSGEQRPQASAARSA